jgi:DNA-binding NarL/FixJ family response regulator
MLRHQSAAARMRFPATQSTSYNCLPRFQLAHHFGEIDNFLNEDDDCGNTLAISTKKVRFDRRKAGDCVSSVRILVVDDYEPFRRFFCSTLGKKADLQIIGEALDGLEAVQKAEELHPDLIVLDLGLPTLNGIEAARRIRKVSPNSKITFMTLESSADVVQEAFSLGAMGYVIKTRAGSELLAAVEAVRQGKQFISSGLSGLTFSDNADAQRPDRLDHEEGVPSLAVRKGVITRSHKVQFHSDDASLLVGFTSFVEAALLVGDGVIVVATESHQKSLLQRLQEQEVDIAAAIEEGCYLPVDAAETLSTFMVNDLPDPIRFLKVAGDLVMEAAKAAKGKPPRVAACGECAPILWDVIATTYNVDILCGYVLNSFEREQESHIYERICAEHSSVRTA